MQSRVVVAVHPRRVRLRTDRGLQVQVVVVTFHQILNRNRNVLLTNLNFYFSLILQRKKCQFFHKIYSILFIHKPSKF
jgi:hypothetical protein